MNLALSSRSFPPRTGVPGMAEAVRRLGLEALHLAKPPSDAVRVAPALKELGVAAAAVEAEGPQGACAEDAAAFEESLARAAAAAALLRARVVVVEGGSLPSRGAADLARRDRVLADLGRKGGRPDASEALKLREEVRVAAAERAVRTLHAAVRRGIPVAIRNGGGVGDLLGLEETGWVLDEVPRLLLWIDPARAERLHRIGAGPPPAEWADRLARRTGGVFLHGLDSALEPHAHPEDGRLDWSTLAASLPRAVPWVLDLGPSGTERDAADALRFARSFLS